jgi:Spy/CpxP family protein refolding chaperone
MRRDWLLYLVIFSLALNLGTIGTFAYLHWRGPGPPPPPEATPMPFHHLMKELGLDSQQRQALRAMAPEHWRKVRELEQNLLQQRQELFALIKQGEVPEWPPVEAKVREIGGLQTQLEEEKVHHLLNIEKNLRPDQRQMLISQLEKRLPECCGGGPDRGRGMMRRLRQGQGFCPPGPPPAPLPGSPGQTGPLETR